MINIIKEEVQINNDLKKKINTCCIYCKYEYEVKNGYLQHIKNSNIGYIAPHIVLINKIVYLFYNDVDYFKEYGKNERIPLDQLLVYISRH